MILVGDKNNSSKKITCNEFNNFTPIKIGRKDNTASNVIKILVGDSNNKAKEVYFMPLYDWRGTFSNNAPEYGIGSNLEVIAKYKDDIVDRDPTNSYANVDTLIINQYEDDYDIVVFKVKDEGWKLYIYNEFLENYYGF